MSLHQQPLSIMIVEDNPGDLYLLEESLALTRLQVARIYKARSVQEAIHLLSEYYINMILLDLSLPDSTGFDSFVHISDYAAGIPIIVLTGLADMELALETMANGAQDYLIKGEYGERLLFKSIQYSVERNRILESLRESSESYRNLFFNNPLPIIIWDIQSFRLLEVNEAAQTQYGFSREEFLTKTIVELGHESEYTRLLETARVFRDTDLMKETALWTHLNNAGELMIMDISSHKIEYKGNLAILAIHNDITETIQLQEKLEEEKLLKQKELNEAIIKVQEKERNEISTELHDNVNQQLTVAMMYIASAQQQLGTDSELLKQSQSFILNAIEEIRKLSQILVTPLIRHFGLSKAIEGLLDDVNAVNSFDIDYRCDTFYEQDIPYEFKLNIFRIVQEQMNNIIKYSRADEVTIILSRDDQHLLLSIADNGVGFDVNMPRKGIGLHNISSRTDVYNGLLEIKTSPGNGCEIYIKFPYTPLQEEARNS
jgi:PAS domain S-box-containing protein